MFKNNPDRDVTFAVEINLKSTFCLMEGISGLKNEKPFERSCRQLIKSILTLHDDAFGNTSKDIVRSLFVNISCRKKKMSNPKSNRRATRTTNGIVDMLTSLASSLFPKIRNKTQKNDL